VLKGEPSNIDPHGNTELVAMTTQVQIFETLVKKDEDGNIVPCLAESWEQIDDVTIRFKLRDDVYFHNGDKLTAEDVVFSIQRATEKPSSASIFAAFDAEKHKVVDDLTVDVATKKPFAAVFNYLTSTRGAMSASAPSKKWATTHSGAARLEPVRLFLTIGSAAPALP
jgi:peptide/nickel transport system substrate-binding protein